MRFWRNSARPALIIAKITRADTRRPAIYAETRHGR